MIGDHKYGSRSRETVIRLYSVALEFPWQGENLRIESEPEWDIM